MYSRFNKSRITLTHPTLLPMDKRSTLSTSGATLQSTTKVRLQPRHSTIERLRQLARATFSTPLGTTMIVN